MRIFEKTTELEGVEEVNSESIDDLVYTAVFSPDEETKKHARTLIREGAKKLGIQSSSIHNLYTNGFGSGKVTGFTVPAFNIRAMTYDSARLLFGLAKEKKAGAFIFEIARSEIGYTDQRPDEYATVVLAAAIAEGWQGAVFLQGDHFQFSKKKYAEDPEKEKGVIRDLIKESLDADFQNIDIDASTLVDLSKENLDDQQSHNYKVTAELTRYIRSLEKGTTVSIGGEIGHIGGVNSTVEDFDAFMNAYRADIEKDNLTGISKVSVQTGTSHGGIPLPDGRIADVKLDFNVLKNISHVARSKYGMGGAVQHGASTLPNDLFNKFPENDTLEIHLATGFQNIVYENMPQALREKMHEWTSENCVKEREEGWNDEQYIYKCRKKAIGPFKKDLWTLSDEEKQRIRDALRKQFTHLFDELNIVNTFDAVSKYIATS